MNSFLREPPSQQGFIATQEILHALYEYSLRAEFSQERRIARELFGIATGKVNDDDPFFEQRMVLFQDYFVFDYRLSEGFSGATILETFIFNAEGSFSKEMIYHFEELRSFKYSLFQTEKHSDHQIEVLDLLNGQKNTVHCLPSYLFTGFDTHPIFEGRLIHFHNQSYFTAGFILHSKEVSSTIKNYVSDFLRKKNHCKAELCVNWLQELNKRNVLFSKVTEQKIKIELNEKKKSVELLRITQKLSELSDKISSENLVMALGYNGFISAFIPETPFYDPAHLLHKLSYCELRSYRYKHISPIKIYALGSDKNMGVEGVPKIPKRGDPDDIASNRYLVKSELP